MEQIAGLKQAEGKFGLIGDRITMMAGKLEDLVFRAQKIAACKKNNRPVTDTMFSYDLQAFRRDIRNFGHEVGALPNALDAVLRASRYEENAVKYAQQVWRLSDRLAKSLAALGAQALLAHSHIRESDAKIEAWYLAQEIEQMVDKGKSLPTIANKILLKVSDPNAKDEEADQEKVEDELKFGSKSYGPKASRPPVPAPKPAPQPAAPPPGAPPAPAQPTQALPPLTQAPPPQALPPVTQALPPVSQPPKPGPGTPPK